MSLPLLISGAILGIMSGVTTSETPVVIGLTVLLLLWLIVPLNWELRAVGCLLLLLWSDYPTSLLLLRPPVLSIRYNLEVLGLS
jgi:hypothetical protein